MSHIYRPVGKYDEGARPDSQASDAALSAGYRNAMPSGGGTRWITVILLLVGTITGLVPFARTRQTRALSTPVVAADARPSRRVVEPEPTHVTFVERSGPVAAPTYPPLTPSEEPAVSVAPPPMAAFPLTAPVTPW